MSDPRTCANCGTPIGHRAASALYCSGRCGLAFARRAKGISPRPGDAERFWRSVRKDESGCWLWTASANGAGYGQVYFEGRRQGAHRAAWAITGQPAVEDGLHLDHLCRVRICVNPAHLEPVTPQENTLRGMSPMAQNAAKDQCKFGHPFTLENTYIRMRDGRASRICKTCVLAANRARRAAARVLQPSASRSAP